jgi:hypothetical protein
MSITLHSRKALTAYRGVLRAIRDHVAPAAQTADAWMNAASAEFRKYQHVRFAKIHSFVRLTTSSHIEICFSVYR